MYLLITKSKYKNKIYLSAKVARSYKTSEGKSRQEIIQKLGPIKSKEDEIKYRQIVQEMNHGKEFVEFNSVEIESAKNYGVFYVVEELCKKYNIKNILEKNTSNTRHKFKVYEILQALIVNRLENPQSKNKAYKYIKKDYPKKINCKKDDLYSTMDILYDNKEKIEVEIFDKLKAQLNLNLKNVHYDITSSYFEGHKCKIALFGYSRDHRNDRKQIVIGLVLVDGIPIYHEVFGGNTSDKTTVVGVVENLRERFGLNGATVIGDRGMMTENNLQELEIKNQKYILGFSKDKNKITEELLQLDVPIKTPEKQGAILGKKDLAKYSKEEQKYEFVRRYILCMDSNTREERLETLENVKIYMFEKLIKLSVKYKESQGGKGKKMSYESLVSQVKKIVSRNKLLYNLKWGSQDVDIKGFEFELNEKWYAREQKAAGKFVIVTNEDREPMEILKTYKDLNSVESCFNCVKNVLDWRPINHYKESRVRAHVFICVLALLIEKIMERLVKDTSAQSMIEELKRIRQCSLHSGQKDKKILTKLSLEQKLIFKKLGLYLK